MIILGIDPGLRCTGYGGIRLQGAGVTMLEAGVIRTHEANPLAERLTEIAGGLAQILEEINPEVMVVENLYSHYKHPRTAILMGHARGVLILAAAGRGIPVINYPATRIKKSLTGNGRASKLQVQRSILAVLGMAKLPQPPDVADALAIALCHANVLMHEQWGSRRGEASE